MNNLVKDKPMPTQFISVFSQMIVKVSLYKILTITRCKNFLMKSKPYIICPLYGKNM